MSTSALERAWQLDERVALRPERFGALAYHYGTRRLSFLKTHTLFELVSALDGHATARQACSNVGIDDAELPRYERALKQLAATGMIRERTIA